MHYNLKNVIHSGVSSNRNKMCLEIYRNWLFDQNYNGKTILFLFYICLLYIQFHEFFRCYRFRISYNDKYQNNLIYLNTLVIFIIITMEVELISINDSMLWRQELDAIEFSCSYTTDVVMFASLLFVLLAYSKLLFSWYNQRLFYELPKIIHITILYAAYVFEEMFNNPS